MTTSSGSHGGEFGSPSDHTASPGEYLPIADHGLVGDLHSVALVGTNGTIDWFCCPAFDSPSVFGSLLDASRGGFFALGAAVPARTRQFYIPDTNVLITRFFAEEGVGEIQDFMPLRDSSTGGQRLVRRVQCVRGNLPFRMRAAPRFNYGSHPHVVSTANDGVLFTSSELSLYLGSTEPLALDERDAVTEFTLEEGGVAVFSLEEAGASTELRVGGAEETLDELMSTVRFWWHWLSASRYRGRWREVVHRSALTLKLLTYAPTGAIIAAPTTSLPEQIGGERNWDYRYVWVRDAAFCAHALLRLGFEDEATAFMNFLLTQCAPPDGSPHGPLQVMYGIDGRADLAERELPDLEGYRGSAPVRVGNGAAHQLQLDIYGELMDSVYLYDKWAQPVSSDQWEAIRARTDWVCANWDQPDEGIWETRGGRQRFLYSRLMCWVAVERAIRLSVHRGLPADQVHWSQVRDEIYSRVMAAGWSNERQAFVQHEGSTVLDASVLMLPIAKFISPTDPKWLSTLDQLSEALVSDTLVYRYDPEASPDGLRGREGTFTVCSFWYVEALTGAGRLDEARIAFEKMLTYGNHVGLYAEQISQTGEQQGNFPQALTHLALINAALNLDRSMG